MAILQWAVTNVLTITYKGVMVAPRPPLLTAEERQHRLEQVVSELLVAAHPLDVSVEDIHAEIDRQWMGAGIHI